MAEMTFKPDHVLKRTTSIVLALYVGAFLGQALCAFHVSDVESQMAAGPNGFAPHAMSSMATYGSPPAVVHTSSWRATHDPSQHGEHPGRQGPEHSGACAVVACASAVTTTSDYGLVLTQGVSSAHMAYLGEMLPPDAEMVLPPPRLG
jgi:hypothetical protein